MLRNFTALIGLCGMAFSATLQANDLCNPLNVGTCAIPFPSDYWAQASSQSPTGVELFIENEVLRPEILDQLPIAEGISPAALFNGSSGFSAASAVVFEFETRPVKKQIDATGGSQVVAYDLTTNEFVAIRSQVSTYARSSAVNGKSEIVEVYPISRWPFRHQIVVAVTEELPLNGETKDLNYFARDPGASAKQVAYMGQLQSAIVKAGLNPDEIRTATMFTVRDQAEVLAPVQKMVADTWERDHPIEDLKVDYLGYNDNKIAIITGRLRTDNYRTNGLDGGMVDFNKAPVDQWIRFRLTLPKASRTEGRVPVAFYAHGLATNKETDALMSGMNADLGIATFSVNFPNHGLRAKDDGGDLLNNIHVKHLPTVLGMLVQHIFDFTSAHKALLSLANLDVVRTRVGLFSCWQCGDRIPDIDTSRVFMEGTSLGGVLGSAYGALSPELMGASYHVAGVGITGILSDSVLWDTVFSRLEPSAANGAEALMMRGAIQHAMDPGDSINYLELFRNPTNGQGPRPLMIMTGARDGIVPNTGSTAMAVIADLPLVGTQRYEMPGVRLADDYDPEGYGVTQFRPLAYLVKPIVGDLVTRFSSHLSFFWPAMRQEQRQWIKRFILDQ